MTPRQKSITTLSLIVALGALSPVVMADADQLSRTERLRIDQGKRQKYVLKQEQLDNVTAGYWATVKHYKSYMYNLHAYNACSDFFCRAYHEDNMNILESSGWVDDPGPVQCHSCE